MHRSSLALTVLVALGLSVSASAAGGGSYKGKIAYQGYDITFKITGSKISGIEAQMLQDCAGDGMSEVFTIAPDASWKIRNGRFSGKKVQTYDDIEAHVTFKGTVKGSTVKGFIREWDYIDGVGIVCDTLNRKFTAKRR